MDKETIFVRVTDKTMIEDLVTDLRDAGIECHEKLCLDKITTKNVVLKCIRIPIGENHRDHTRGLRCVGCFGFDDETTKYMTKGNNICEGFELIKYVKDMEEMGY